MKSRQSSRASLSSDEGLNQFCESHDKFQRKSVLPPIGSTARMVSSTSNISEKGYHPLLRDIASVQNKRTMRILESLQGTGLVPTDLKVSNGGLAYNVSNFRQSNTSFPRLGHYAPRQRQTQISPPWETSLNGSRDKCPPEKVIEKYQQKMMTYENNQKKISEDLEKRLQRQEERRKRVKQRKRHREASPDSPLEFEHRPSR